ncbi:hypothetical protein AB0H71_25735 [Nocardia sp. NPDC050697]|uniref:hypothetical protein n=1 Tax=Nocardia sp. NPDC050697 TaxID=3155158 RepID=UPI0033FCAEF9
MTRNDSASWQPFSDRNAGRPADARWHEGVPEWLEHPLREWLDSQFVDEGTRRQVAARLRYVPERGSRYWRARSLPTVALLEWVDATLDVISRGESLFDSLTPMAISEVDAVLEGARSVWRVSSGGNALERRHDQVVTDAVRQAGAAADAAGRSAAAARLRTAWDAAFRFHPDPSVAYREAVLAVEAAAIPVVVPRQAGATLGHVLGQLDRQGQLYRVAICDRSGVSAPTTAVVQMIRLLWEGHTDRHEGVTAALPITAESACMAVTLAVTLVQWFTSGAVQPR